MLKVLSTYELLRTNKWSWATLVSLSEGMPPCRPLGAYLCNLGNNLRGDALPNSSRG